MNALRAWKTATLTAAAVGLALVAAAGHECQSWNVEPELTTPATGVSTNEGEGTYYVDNDMCQPQCLFSVWIYEETNGVPGLQRGDELGDQECVNAPPDTIIL